MWGIEKAPQRIVARFTRVVLTRMLGFPGAGKGWYIPQLGDIAYTCPYKPLRFKGNLKTWTVNDPVMLSVGGAKTGFWYNGVLLIKYPNFKLPGKIINVSRFDPSGIKNGDRIQKIILYYHPAVYHAPFARVISFNVSGWFDARYFDVVWTRYPESAATFRVLPANMIVWHLGDELVAALKGVRLPEKVYGLFRKMEEERCLELSG